MFKVLLASHGRLCEGMLDTLKIFVSDVDSITAIPYYVEGVDSEAAFTSFKASIKENDKVLVFTDIMMGSVNQNIVVQLQAYSNVHIVSGFNLPMVLELIACHPDDIESECIAQKVSTCASSMVYMNTYQVNYQDGDE